MPLVPETKTIEIDFDKYGHCVLCHRDLRIKRITSDGPVDMFSSDHMETQFLLNDGSRMTICVCKKCFEEGIEDKKEEIMKSVFKGWEMETMYLVEDKNKTKWNEEKRKKYLDFYKTKKIICLSKYVDPDVLEKKLKEYKDKEEKEKEK